MQKSYWKKKKKTSATANLNTTLAMIWNGHQLSHFFTLFKFLNIKWAVKLIDTILRRGTTEIGKRMGREKDMSQISFIDTPKVGTS